MVKTPYNWSFELASSYNHISSILVFTSSSFFTTYCLHCICFNRVFYSSLESIFLSVSFHLKQINHRVLTLSIEHGQQLHWIGSNGWSVFPPLLHHWNLLWTRYPRRISQKVSFAKKGSRLTSIQFQSISWFMPKNHRSRKGLLSCIEKGRSVCCPGTTVAAPVLSWEASYSLP